MSQLPDLPVDSALKDMSERFEVMQKEFKRVKAELEAVRARADLGSATLAAMAASMDAPQRFTSQKRLEEIVLTESKRYRAAKPFPHIVIDDFVDPGILRTIVEEFRATDRSVWNHTEGLHEQKFSTEDEQGFGPFTRALIHVLNAGPFLTFVEKLTGVKGLISDPYLRGGGLHEIKRGGSLGVHADFNYYKRLKLYRRLNLIVYLNEGWQDEWGGHLELWEKDGRAPVARVAPIFNRAVMFETSNESYHGHPQPIRCPEDRARQSLALYYYSVDYPYEHDRAPHSTTFLDTPTTHEH